MASRLTGIVLPLLPPVIDVRQLLSLPASASGISPGAEMVDALSRTLSLLFWVLLLAIILPLVFIVYRKILPIMGSRKTQKIDPLKELDRLERKGDFLAAAAICERLKDFSSAASLFERGKDYNRAGEMYEHDGKLEKAAGCYLKSGGSVKAAGLFIKNGDYLEAAKIFKNKGDHLRAAQALEMLGNKAAAAREYRQSGQFERAARLLKEESMFAEAAETYRHALHDEPLSDSNVDRYYTYAAFLALAKEGERAADIYRLIYDLKGDYRKVSGNLRALGHSVHSRPLPAHRDLPPLSDTVVKRPDIPADQADSSTQSQSESASISDSLRSEIDESCGAPAKEEDRLRKATTLRSMIAYDRLEPRYSMRLWIQIMKVLKGKHTDSIFSGRLTPESIRIDMENNVEIDEPQREAGLYTAPEILAGQSPGPHSDIYSMGVILFEMVTGSLAELNVKRPAEIYDDIPDWLDELIIKCTKKDRRDRFLNTEDVFAALVRLKKSL